MSGGRGLPAAEGQLRRAPKVLICTVGGQPAPIANAVRENGPLDLVVFLTSAGPSASASAASVRRMTTRERRHRCPHCDQDFVDRTRVAPLASLAGLEEGEFRVEGIEDPDDLGQVLAACERIEAELGRRFSRSKTRVIANYTGGTKTMSVGLALYALRRADRSWTLQLNRLTAGRRSNLVGIRAGDQPAFQDLSRALASAASGWVQALAERHEYSAAARVVSQALAQQRLRIEDQRPLLAEGQRYRFLAARDRGDFDSALALAGQDAELESVHGPRLRLLSRIAGALANPGPWPDPTLDGVELVDELRESARRAADRDRFDLAAGSLIRACHVLASLRLRRIHGRDSGSDLWTDYDDLLELGDPLGRYFAAHQGELRELVWPWRGPLGGYGALASDRQAWALVSSRWQEWLDGAQEIL